MTDQVSISSHLACHVRYHSGRDCSVVPRSHSWPRSHWLECHSLRTVAGRVTWQTFHTHQSGFDEAWILTGTEKDIFDHLDAQLRPDNGVHWHPAPRIILDPRMPLSMFKEILRPNASLTKAQLICRFMKPHVNSTEEGRLQVVAEPSSDCRDHSFDEGQCHTAVVFSPAVSITKHLTLRMHASWVVALSFDDQEASRELQQCTSPLELDNSVPTERLGGHIARCEAWCASPCTELTGRDLYAECGACNRTFACRP